MPSPARRSSGSPGTPSRRYPPSPAPAAPSPPPRTARRVRPWSSSPGNLVRVAVGGECIRQRREGRAVAHRLRHAGACELLLHRIAEPREDEPRAALLELGVRLEQRLAARVVDVADADGVDAEPGDRRAVPLGG